MPCVLSHPKASCPAPSTPPKTPTPPPSSRPPSPRVPPPRCHNPCPPLPPQGRLLGGGADELPPGLEERDGSPQQEHRRLPGAGQDPHPRQEPRGRRGAGSAAGHRRHRRGGSRLTSGPSPPFSCRSKPWRRSCWRRRRSWRRSGTSTGSGCSKVSAGRARMSPEAWGDGEPGRSRPPVHPPTHPSVPQCWRSTSSPRRRWWPTRG